MAKKKKGKASGEPERKPETEPETKPAAEPETKPEAEPEAKPVAEPEAKSEAEPETKPEVEPEAKPEAEPEAKPEAEPETKPEPEPEMKPVAAPETKPVAAPETKPEAEPEKPGRRRCWPRFLLFWAALLVIAGLIGCFLFYQYLGIYEVPRPEILMDELMTLMSADDWLEKAGKELDFELTEFEDAHALYAVYRSSLTTDQELTYRSEKGETDGEHAVFIVRCGPSNLCRVELVSDGRRLPFGRHGWSLGRISSGDIIRNLRSTTAEITALAGQEITLNDRPVDESFLADEAVPIENLSDIESRMDTVPVLRRYKVGPLYGEIHVSVDGKELLPEQKGRTLRYLSVTEGTGSLTIRAPEDLRVTVGGAELNRKDASERSLALLEGLEDYTGDAAYLTNTYRFTGLYTEPEVLAYDAKGRELRPIMTAGNCYNFFHPSDEAADEADEAELAHLWELAEGFFGDYVNYTTKPFDGNLYYKLLNCTLSGSQLKAYIAQSNATMKWAAHSTTEQTLHYDNLHRIGDACYTCTVEFELDKTSSTWVEEVSSTEENAEQLVFARVGKYWFAAAMSMIGD